MICVNRNLDFVTVSQSSFFCLKTMLESASYFTLFEVFDSPDKDVLKDVCWSISNLTTPITGDQIQAVLDAGIVPKLFQLLKVEQPNLQKEAACIVYNAIKYGNPNQVRYLIGEGVILLLSNLLPVSDLEVVTFALGGLETILQLDSKDYNLLETVVEVLCDDGMEAIERLQRHYLDQRISDSVKNILHLTFGKHLISEDPCNQLKSIQYYRKLLSTGKYLSCVSHLSFE